MRGLQQIRHENIIEAARQKKKLGDWPEDHGEVTKPITEGEFAAEKVKAKATKKSYRQSTIR